MTKKGKIIIKIMVVSGDVVKMTAGRQKKI